MMKKWKMTLLLTVCLLGLVVASCLDAAENEYRVTAPTFATVTTDGAGNYRLYLDEKRGILIPSEESAVKHWKNTRRAYIKYDLPYLNEVKETTSFRTIVRDAKRIEVVDLADVTGLEVLPDTLGTEVVNNFALHAYWGYITLQVASGNNNNCRLTCSYDRNRFVNDEKMKCDTLFMDLHYAKGNGTWNMEIPQTVCAEIPDFVRSKTTADSLCIVVSGKVWYDSRKDSVVTLSRGFRMGRVRLDTPSYQ
ncbi:MAG: hypothetical protein IJX44_00350 [Bacteroidaceae bacterium]|nr:hypothetical protein [Bacteroidaceae bacterium]